MEGNWLAAAGGFFVTVLTAAAAAVAVAASPLTADITFSTEGMVVITALVAGLSAAIGVLFKLLLTAKDETIGRIDSSRLAWRRLAEQATWTLEAEVIRHAAEAGLPPPVRPLPAAPGVESRATAEAQNAADTAAVRARLAVAAVALGCVPPGTRRATPEEEAPGGD